MTLQPSAAHLLPRNIAMKYLLLIAAVAALTTGAAAATELPTYQAQGFPITSHQVAILGAAGVEEQSAAATDMPASPHQMAVLTPRTMKVGQQAAAQPTTAGSTLR
jgi:hypothetical protein